MLQVRGRADWLVSSIVVPDCSVVHEQHIRHGCRDLGASPGHLDGTPVVDLCVACVGPAKHIYVERVALVGADRTLAGLTQYVAVVVGTEAVPDIGCAPCDTTDEYGHDCC